MNSQEARDYGNLTTHYWRMRIIKNSSSSFFPQILVKYREITDKQLLWELIKMELRAKTIKYSKEKRSKLMKYFFNLEKNSYEKKLIREVKSENDEVISNFVQVNKEIENFYSKMYTSKITGNNTSDVSEPTTITFTNLSKVLTSHN